MENGNCKISFRDTVLEKIQCIHYNGIHNEEWHIIPEFENYRINLYGTILHLNSYAGKPRILVPRVTCSKRLYITLTSNGKRIGIAVDKLMVTCFHGIALNEIKKIKHLDGVKCNNQIQNLECEKYNPDHLSEESKLIEIK